MWFYLFFSLTGIGFNMPNSLNILSILTPRTSRYRQTTFLSLLVGSRLFNITRTSTWSFLCNAVEADPCLSLKIMKIWVVLNSFPPGFRQCLSCYSRKSKNYSFYPMFINMLAFVDSIMHVVISAHISCATTLFHQVKHVITRMFCAP